MTELDLEIPGLAAELIRDFGKEITYQITTTDNYNPDTMEVEPAGDPIVIRAIVEPYHGQRMIAGLVEVGDYKVTIAAESFPEGQKPTPADVATIDGDGYRVKNAMAIYSGDLVAVYQLQVGR